MSIGDEFEEGVEGGGGGGESGDFGLYMRGEGGGNVGGDCESVRVGGSGWDEVKE